MPLPRLHEAERIAEARGGGGKICVRHAILQQTRETDS